MKHARDDYSRISDPLGNPELLEAYDAAMGLVARNHPLVRSDDFGAAMRVLARLTRALSPTLGLCIGPHAIPMGRPIGADEPVFLLRATDRLAPGTVQFWLERFNSRGNGDAAVAADARHQRDRMLAWQERHPELVHVADLPGDPSRDVVNQVVV